MQKFVFRIREQNEREINTPSNILIFMSFFLSFKKFSTEKPLQCGLYWCIEQIALESAVNGNGMICSALQSFLHRTCKLKWKVFFAEQTQDILSHDCFLWFFKYSSVFTFFKANLPKKKKTTTAAMEKSRQLILPFSLNWMGFAFHFVLSTTKLCNWNGTQTIDNMRNLLLFLL